MDGALEHPQQLLKDGQNFVAKCTKPSRTEYVQILRAVGAGFLMMGAIGYVVKLVHIPIRHLITSSKCCTALLRKSFGRCARLEPPFTCPKSPARQAVVVAESAPSQQESEMELSSLTMSGDEQMDLVPQDAAENAQAEQSLPVGNNAVSETLSMLLNKPAIVATYGGNEHRGILEAVDGYMNVVLRDTTEYYLGKVDGTYSGSLFIKGATVLYISAA